MALAGKRSTVASERPEVCKRSCLIVIRRPSPW
jgi:hypothetical protein